MLTNTSSLIPHPSSFIPHRFPRRQRRGVLLLVVLSLLALFSVVVITYVMVAGVTRRAATSASRVDLYETPPEELGQRALLDILRGTHNPMSPLQGHDLLGDLYGEDWIEAQIELDNNSRLPAGLWMANEAKPMFVRIPFQFHPSNGQYLPFPANNTKDSQKQLSPHDGYYNGLVLTILDGPLAGQSRRILEYFAPNSPTPNDLNSSLGNGLNLLPASIVVEAFDVNVAISAAGGNPRQTVDAAIQQALAGRRFLINGRPFNGTGEGYDPTYTPGTSPGSIVSYALPPTGSGDFPKFYAWMPNWRAAIADPHARQYRATLRNQEHGAVNAATGQATRNLSLADEDYDAVDQNNMFLAMLLPTPQDPTDTTSPRGHIVPIPSFFRPDLAMYWASVAPNSWRDPAFRRRIIMRPVSQQGDEFSFNNPAFEQFLDDIAKLGVTNLGTSDRATRVQEILNTMLGGVDGNPPWDVDNDGDGKMDSLWLDPGYEVQTAPDGRRYKVLVAPLIVDLNGRLNLNAHGSLAHIFDNGAAHDAGTQAAYASAWANPLGDRPRGMGVGPADVDLSTGGVLAKADYVNLLTGSAVRNPAYPSIVSASYPGRYGESLLSTSPSGGIPDWMATAESIFPTQLQAIDRTRRSRNSLAERKHWWLQQIFPMADLADVNRPIWYDSSYQTPLDVWGTGTLWLGGRGTPLYRRFGGLVATGQRHGSQSALNADSAKRFAFAWNNPYELDLSPLRPRAAANGTTTVPSTAFGSQPEDAIFGVGELERLLRFYDKDAGVLPDRLLQLATNSFADARRRQLVTTTSFDLPVPAIHAPSANDSRALATATNNGQVQPLHLIDLLRAKMSNLPPDQFNRMVRFYLAPELLAGRKLDLNRLFGDGVDSDGDGMIDESDELGNDLAVAHTAGTNRQFTLFWHNNGQSLSPNTDRTLPVHRLHARQIMARHLYILAHLLVNNNFAVQAKQGETNEQARARTLAQWAINVVDFQDRDPIMSYFEYDIDPFTDSDGDGIPWDVDGDPSTDEAGTYRRVVWGAERPELLITETLATHDRRTADESNDDGIRRRTTDPNGDSTYDQVRRPQGNLLVEIYNPQSPLDAPHGEKAWNDPANQNLYARSTQPRTRDLNQDGLPDVGLNLAAIAGNPGDPNNSSPVWRMAITRRFLDIPNIDPDFNPALDTDPVLPLNKNRIERAAYFVDYPRVNNLNALRDGLDNSVVRFGLPDGTLQNVEMLVRPGAYAVVGPTSRRTFTTDPSEVYFGQRAGGNTPADRQQNRFPRDILIDTRLDRNPGAPPRTRGGGVRTQDDADIELPGPYSPDVRKAALGVPIAPAFPTADRKVRFSISEPLGGYRVRDDIGGNPNDDDAAFTGNYPDIPFDSDPTWWNVEGNVVDVDQPNRTLPQDPNSAIGYKRVYLQRLANPSQPYHKDLNPYLTVDYMDVDLTIYNSEPDGNNEPGAAPNGQVRFDSRRRGTLAPNPALQTDVWAAGTANTQAPTVGSVPQPLPNQTFGFLNDTFGGLAGNMWTIADVAPLLPAGVSAWDYAGDPKNNPFPWFSWNNRPFVSEAEMLLVPRGGPIEMLAQHTTQVPGLNDLYDPTGQIGGAQPVSEFHHLHNLFASDGAAGSNQPEFHRLLEYCHVPSPFVGTEEVLDGTVLANPNNAVAEALRLRPPFNIINRYREPGRVNVNTVFDASVWNTLTDIITPNPGWHASTWWDGTGRKLGIVDSRRGVSGVVTSPLDAVAVLGLTPFAPPPPDSMAPPPPFQGFFSRPFRSFAGGQLRPGTIDMSTGSPTLRSDSKPGAEMTLLRPRGTGEDATGFDKNEPLFATSFNGPPTAYKSSERHPYFRYHGLQKMTNLLSTHSNQFAIWLTVGYFEVRPLSGAPNAQYPDGYVLGRELGSDDGTVARHRMFYVVDRTIPVGYRRGENNNVRECIMLKRFIE